MTTPCDTAPKVAAWAHCTPLEERTLRGDPVDVATGWVVLPQDDIRLAGVLALTLSRTHISTYRLGRWFGESWASTVDQRVEVTDDALRLVRADGSLLTYPIPVDGGDVPGRACRCAASRAATGSSRATVR